MSETLMAALIEVGVHPDKAARIASELWPAFEGAGTLNAHLQVLQRSVLRNYQIGLCCMALQIAVLVCQSFNAYASFKTHAATVELRQQIEQLRSLRSESAGDLVLRLPTMEAQP